MIAFDALRRRALAGASMLLAGCSPIAALNAVAPSGTHRRDADLAYGSDPRHRLDLYRPLFADAAPSDAAQDRPLLLFLYGGSWNRGERADYRFVGEALASRGIAVAIADYRLYPQVRYPEFLRDSAAALAWLLREAPRLALPTQRLFVMGHSAGGYNAAMLALDARWLQPHGLAPERLAGWIGLAGAYDFVPIRNPDVQPVFHHPDVPRDSQPIEYAARSRLPALLAAPERDALIDPERNTGGLARALAAAGAPVQLRRYPRANHLTLAAAFSRPLRWIAPVLDDTVAFIESTPRPPG